ncbi:hypothetical protein [Mycolicibacterium thermoresistibile]
MRSAIDIEVARLPAGTVLVTVLGDVRSDVSMRLHRMIADQLTALPSLVAVDVTDVGWVDPAALVLLASCGAMAEQSHVAFGLIDAPGGPLRNVLDGAGLGDLFEVFDSVGEALGSSLTYRLN